MSMPQPRMSELGTADAALLDTLLREAPIGFALFGPDLCFRRVNDMLARLYGRDPEAHIGQKPSHVWPSEFAATAESAARQVLAEDQPVFGAHQYRTPGTAAAPAPSPAGLAGAAVPRDTNGAAAGTLGETAHLALSWFPSHDGDGHITGVVLIAVDVTSRQRSEDAIRRSEERYRSLVLGGAQIVWVADADGEITEDCPEWRWVTGQSLEEFLGSGWQDAIHPEDRDRVGRDWQTCVKSGKTFDDRYRVRTRAGSYRHYDVRAVPVERDGKVVEWVGASTDVTGQREAEEMRGRLTEQLSAAALRTARLQQATSMLAEALTVEQVVEVITEVGRTAIGAQRSAVALLDGGRLKVINPAGMPPGQSAATRDILLDSPGVMTRAIATRRPVLAEDTEALRVLLEDAPIEIVAGEDERSWVGLPLLAAGAPLGALRFSFGRPRKITEEERVFLEALAGQCALAVERAAMYEREHTTAETLQRSLLPDQLPLVPGLVMEARYLPVARNMEIGGDWYDAFRLPDGRLAIAVGDVMGKGLTAAAGMGRVRNALRALALTDPRPAAVLTGLDRLFSATELEEQVTTVAYLVIDPQTGDGLMGNAGHLPVLRLGLDAEPFLDETEAGTPLGWPSPRQQHPFRLPSGGTAVLYSDGLVENRIRGLDAGLNELVAVAARARGGVVGHPERLLSYLVDAMLAGHEQDDDATATSSFCMCPPATSPRAMRPPARGTARPAKRMGHDPPGEYSAAGRRRICAAARMSVFVPRHVQVIHGCRLWWCE
jgi:PAS domain S-box-containing protein